MKILFIENHSTFAKTVMLAFLTEHQVKVVPSIKLAKKELEHDNQYDIALIDYDLDDGKGDEITKTIKQFYPKIKIIATSSHSKGNNLIQQAGANAICGKMDFKNIQAVINSIT